MAEQKSLRASECPLDEIIGKGLRDIKSGTYMGRITGVNLKRGQIFLERGSVTDFWDYYEVVPAQEDACRTDGGNR